MFKPVTYSNLDGIYATWKFILNMIIRTNRYYKDENVERYRKLEKKIFVLTEIIMVSMNSKDRKILQKLFGLESVCTVVCLLLKTLSCLLCP